MRISDWSSDVCSSDLKLRLDRRAAVERIALRVHDPAEQRLTHRDHARRAVRLDGRPGDERLVGIERKDEAAVPAKRSEEHTSELQSLMRISYAVFCLNKKIDIHIRT